MSTRRIPFDQESSSPSTKVTAAGVAGAVVVVLSFILESSVGLVLPPSVVAALTTLIALVTAYYVPERIEVPDYGDQYPDPADFEDE